MQSPGGAMPGGVITSQSPPFVVPIRYMVLGILCFGLFAIDFTMQSGSFAEGIPGAPNIVALTHLLTLGALLSFVIGAVYQLTTVAFLIPIAGLPAARWNFWLYVVAFIGLFISMSQWWSTGFLIFGIAMATAVYVYAIGLIASLARTKIRGSMFGFIVSAHVYLILAVSVAVLLVLADAGMVPALGNCMGQLIATHILLAVGGFFTFLVMGFSFKLLPMFTLSNGFETARQKWTLTLAHVTVWVLLAAIWTHWIGLFLAGAIIGIVTFASQVADVRGIIQKRIRKRIEPPIRAVTAATAGGILALALLMIRLFAPQGQAGWQGVVMFYLLGVVTLTVMGFAYKIVPFLVWSKRHSKSAGKGKPVLISDLINLKWAWPVLIGFGVGLVALTASTAAGSSSIAIGSCVILSASILLFCVQIFRVMEPRKLGKELIERE